MLESIFNKVAGQNKLQHRYFPLSIAKCFGAPILKNIWQRLFLLITTCITHLKNDDETASCRL